MSDRSIVQSSASVFVLGCPRSGTSALSWAIAQHSEFWTSAESNFLSHFFFNDWLHRQYKSGTTRGPKHWLSKNNVSYDEYAAYIGLGIDAMYLKYSKNKRWVEQTPEYTLSGMDFAIMFPNTKFIHLVRDGRAVVQSMIHSGFPVAWATDFKLACQTWVRFIEKGFETQRTYPERTIEIRNEDLVVDPERQCRRLFEFLDVGVESGPVEYLQNKRVNSSFKGGLERPRGPWFDWNKEQIKIFRKVAGETLESIGYQLD